MFDGDHNGAVHYVGSKYGQQDFVNPALSGQIKVRPASHSSLQIVTGGVSSDHVRIAQGYDPDFRIQVSASSPRCKFTDARALTSRKFVRVNTACPSREGEVWWQADLGAHHSLACNFYTVRADASGNFLHDWELQVMVRAFCFILLSTLHLLIHVSQTSCPVMT